MASTETIQPAIPASTIRYAGRFCENNETQSFFKRTLGHVGLNESDNHDGSGRGTDQDSESSTSAGSEMQVPVSDPLLSFELENGVSDTHLEQPEAEPEQLEFDYVDAAAQLLSDLTLDRREPDILRGTFQELRPSRGVKRPYISSARALQIYGSSEAAVLTPFEKKEIMDFPKIYCVGMGARKPENSETGMDRTDGRYDARINDHIAYRFQILKILGKGNSSHVVQAYDHKEKRIVALKIFRNRKRFNRMGLIELRLTRKLEKLDPGNIHNLMRFYDAFYFRRHLIFVTEALSVDLLKFIRDRAGEEVNREEICRFTAAVMRALAFLDSNDIIHLDIKPENMLLRDLRDLGSVKLVDFGSARAKHQQATEDYIQTRYYRAPEVIMAQTDLDPKVDIWSFGCVLAEIHTKGAVLLEGENEFDQLARMVEMLGMPSDDLLRKWRDYQQRRAGNGGDVFTNHFRRGLDGWEPVYLLTERRQVGKPGSKRLEDKLNLHKHSRLNSFIDECLKWDPRERLSAEAALKHDLLS